MAWMTDRLKRCLEDLESRLDPAEETRLETEWLDFTENRFRGDIFIPRRLRQIPPRIAWPTMAYGRSDKRQRSDITLNETLRDVEAMLLQQFAGCSQTINDKLGGMLCVRGNYGSSILPSLFGAEIFTMDEELNTLPTSRPLEGPARIRSLIERGVPALYQSLAGMALEMGPRFREIAATYPKIGRFVHIIHPDTQGPMDVCEVLWGSRLFLDVVDEPGLVREFLNLITETYLAYLKEWYRLVPPTTQGWDAHWGLAHKGRIMLRNDSAMNFSPAMFEEFILPYDQRLLDAFGGGAQHFCGRGSHYIARMARLRGYHALAMSQPHLNDMEEIFRHTVDRGIKLLGLKLASARTALASGRSLHGHVQSYDL